MRYTFSSETIAEFYGRKFYSITDSDGNLVAYSEKMFDVPDAVTFHGDDRTLIFEKAVLVKGEMHGGVMRGGVMRGGEMHGGVMWGGEMHGGVMRGGEMRGGVMHGGVMWGGVMHGGVMRGGEMHGGVMRGGVMWGGVMRGGVMHGGVMRGGVMHGGEMHGGVMRGGVMHGGEMHGGVMRGGVVEVSMLQIQGTMHFCYASPTEDGKEIWLGIGCEFHPIDWWIENYKSTGEAEGYTEDEIAEYLAHINLFAQRYRPELLKTKQMRYTFSSETTAEFYGRKFYSITDSDGKLVAYSEKVFNVPDAVTFHGDNRTIVFEKAVLVKGEMHGGVMRGGVMHGGVMRGGVMWGGEMWGGVMWGGEMHGGVMWGGVMWGGVMWGGVMWGGEMRGGVMHGGEMHGGVMRGGVVEVSMLQIQGTRHFCYASPTKDGKEIWLGIGCEFHSIDWWIENYKSTGEAEGYTEDEIAEYLAHINLFAQRYRPELLKTKPKRKN
jgi:hypothetical protein